MKTAREIKIEAEIDAVNLRFNKGIESVLKAATLSVDAQVAQMKAGLLNAEEANSALIVYFKKLALSMLGVPMLLCCSLAAAIFFLKLNIS